MVCMLRMLCMGLVAAAGVNVFAPGTVLLFNRQSWLTLGCPSPWHGHCAPAAQAPQCCLVCRSTDNCARTVRKEDKAGHIRDAVQRGRKLLLDLQTVRGHRVGVQLAGDGEWQAGWIKEGGERLRCRAFTGVRCRQTGLPCECMHVAVH